MITYDKIMSNKNSIKLDFPNKLLKYELKEYLEYNFKVYIQKNNQDLIVHGNKTDLALCQEQADYFRSVDSQFLLLLNDFSREAFNILSFKNFYQSKCKVLMSIDSNVLYIFGQLYNSTQTYNYFCHYNNLIEKDIDFDFSESKESVLNLMCNETAIKLPNEIHSKSKIFIYFLLKHRNELFNKFPNLLNCENSKEEDLVLLKSEILNESCEKVLRNNHSEEDGKCKLNESVSLVPIIQDSQKNYRTVIIDGGNVAFEHGSQKFSPIGIKFAIDYFLKRGHTKVYALLSRRWQPIGGEIFKHLECKGFLKYTPSRVINDIRETPYDDLLILDAAVATNGIVLSNDQYRELRRVKGDYENVICNRLIAFTFIEDHLIIPADPFGPEGPSLDDILIYSDKIQPAEKPQLSSVINKFNKTSINPNVKQSQKSEFQQHQLELYNQVLEIFPDNERIVKSIIKGNPHIRNAEKIINLVIMATKK